MNHHATSSSSTREARWKFLRIQLAHIYRELHRNGGVIHEVWFMMIRYDKQTEQSLLKFIEVANNASKHVIFSVHYLGRPPVHFHHAYKEVFDGIVQHPYKYFKLDDDIVYIHPGAFRTMIEKQIAGSNWRCSWLHQKNDVYNETNPKHLVFEFDPHAHCGWKAADCAELTLCTFYITTKKAVGKVLFLHHSRSKTLQH